MEDIEARIRALYPDPLPRDAGVLHGTAVWRAPDGRLRTLRIGAETPRSPTDAFALQLARARADAIVTTGRILREEPGMHHGLEGPAGEALRSWRRATLGRTAPGRTVVLTSGRDLDLAHPALADGGLVFTGEEAARALRAPAAERGIEVRSDPEPSLRRLVVDLRAEGAGTVLLEAGASSTRALYEPPICVDELCLGVFCGADLPLSVVGEPFLGPDALARALGPARSTVDVAEASGPWRFVRYRRSS